MTDPKFTIITVTYNAGKVLEATIQSVISQTYENVEYILVDGGSKDNTLDLVQSYRNRISQLVSEPDQGLYDAMNKGIMIAKGEWINFMNCGDSFYDNSVIKDSCYHQISLIYFR